ncbi:MAG TPA: alpha-amylase family glycosyl hydrolase [Candidatus Acidoferrum sp.]|nr:alpha-amylase family glycosyl hydrolase [Candidatus Acidoferrum sp.]
MDKARLSQLLRGYCFFGFHLSRKTWDWLDIPTVVEKETAESSAKEMLLLRKLSARINERRVRSAQTPDPIHAGQLASISVLTDIFRYIIELYCHSEQPGVIGKGLDWTSRQYGSSTIVLPPSSFVKLFPPAVVLRGTQSEADFIREHPIAPVAHDTLVRELVLLFLSGINPAFRPFKVLFDDADLKTESPYVPMVRGLESFFSTQPPFGPVGLTLFECLYTPIRACPDSLDAQLDFVRRNWAHFLPLDLLERLLLALDVLREEQTMRGLGPGPSEALRFDFDASGLDLGYAEPAAFSRDADWMSNTVLIAKSVYVWLFQLSRKYQRDIHLLSDIPDEELDQLARWGFTGLWLIGLWERSPASQTIKKIMGNPEAASSAYSLYDYIIAYDLGGEEAFENLKRRAQQRGILLASDMVPNHTGIYSKWVIEHPDWFVQSNYPPFPVYQYTGVDLSHDPRTCLQIEDGYWQHRDAAVVFKRIDKWTGDTRYIYHGNDGTSMPWNDTAQLNFLIPEVREAVIQTILHVARKFPIIRFDAAMTLTKKHYQRLWFPQPGDGGAIPSRAEHGMTKGAFDALMPKEFWREVVDRISAEQPDTLLLAEAFWLMEGFFVRTLGMHRVYNSAFMNMLKMEDNAKYRSTVRNVLEFSPEVLKRFVNFMNNPDERTAVDQFGRGDKYFGVALMMVTMPGLPMFGHGQIEGFSEKYGMEYRRSYWDEQVDYDMVRRHEAQIFPLMRRRRLFSGASNFAMYDFVTPDGWVDENVFAYSNRSGDERAIILYNNAYNTTRGNFHLSTTMNAGQGDETMMVRRTLGEALGLNSSSDCFYVFRDYQSGLEYIRPGRQMAEQGMFAELHAYQYHAFLDFREIHDVDGSWRSLEQRLAGSGVPNMEEAHRELQIEPTVRPYRDIMNSASVRGILNNESAVRIQLRAAIAHFYAAINQAGSASLPVNTLVDQFETGLEAIEKIPAPLASKEAVETTTDEPAHLEVGELRHAIFAWLSLSALAGQKSELEERQPIMAAGFRIDHWLIQKVVRKVFEELTVDGGTAYWDSVLVQILATHTDLLQSSTDELGTSLRWALTDASVRDYLEVNRYNDTLWLSKERLERLMDASMLIQRLAAHMAGALDDIDIRRVQKNAHAIISAAAQAGYQVDAMIDLLTAGSAELTL